jgi:hypothetical protein
MQWTIRGLNPGSDNRFLSSPNCRDGLWGPFSLLPNGCLNYFVGVKRLGRDADHSRPSSAEIRNEYNCTSAPRICVRGMDWDKFAFYI